jgi:hypothetical protein
MQAEEREERDFVDGPSESWEINPRAGILPNEPISLTHSIARGNKTLSTTHSPTLANIPSHWEKYLVIKAGKCSGSGVLCVMCTVRTDRLYYMCCTVVL